MGRNNALMTLKVFLLDDHEMVRRGVRELLEQYDDIEIVGEAGTAEEGVARILRNAARMSRSSTCASPTATASRSAARFARATPRSSVSS